MPKCEICIEKYVRKYGIKQKTCENIACMIAWGKIQSEKERIRHERKKRQDDKAWVKSKKESLRTHGSYENELQKIVNEIARLIDKRHKCISHNGPIKSADGGHYHAVGSSNNVRFNLFNVWAQCDSCNRRKRSNRTGYDEGLKELFGHELWLYINEGLRLQYSHVKLTIPELKECIILAREIVKELKAADLTYTVQQRVDLRYEYNTRIGIYK